MQLQNSRLDMRGNLAFSLHFPNNIYLVFAWMWKLQDAETTTQAPSGAVRVCVGVFAWVPRGFTAVSLPRSSCVPRRSCSARMKLPLPKVNASCPPGLRRGFCRGSSGFQCRIPAAYVAPAWLGEVGQNEDALSPAPRPGWRNQGAPG